MSTNSNIFPQYVSVGKVVLGKFPLPENCLLGNRHLGQFPPRQFPPGTIALWTIPTKDYCIAPG